VRWSRLLGAVIVARMLPVSGCSALAGHVDHDGAPVASTPVRVGAGAMVTTKSGITSIVPRGFSATKS